MDLPIYNALITDDGEGIRLVSLVSDPAVERKFLMFGEQLRFSINDEEKHIITGVLMLADTPIFRRSDSLGEYYVVFQPEVIRLMAEKMLLDGRTTAVSVNHSEKVDDCVLEELYIKDEKRGISPVEFKDVPNGSLFATYKVNNPDLWEKLKNGEYQGFSLEGLFTLSEVDLLEEILKDLKKLRNVK